MRHLTSAGKIRNGTNNRSGAILIMALLLLALITVIGVFAATRSSVEQRIAGNYALHTSVFYVAEGGLKHAKKLLVDQFGSKNLTAISVGQMATWTFLLDGSTYPIGAPAAATMYHCYGCDTGDPGTPTKLTGAWLTSGVEVINRQFDIGNLTVTYTVNAWDNDEIDKYSSTDYPDFDGLCPKYTQGSDKYADATSPDTESNPARDCDGTIYLRSTAKAYRLTSGTPSGDPIAESVQEMLLGGVFKSGGAILSGLSQEFANEGKSSAGVDINEMTDFTSRNL